ncbi:MAG: hypothetical protein ABI843_10535 [Dokdonella sp.]
MTPIAFSAVHAAIAAVGGVLAIVLPRPSKRAPAIDDGTISSIAAAM